MKVKVKFSRYTPEQALGVLTLKYIKLTNIILMEKKQKIGINP
jgi:hypothetical protein